MKKYFTLFLLAIAIVSCSNDDSSVDIPTSTRIIGNWNWISSVGGVDNLTLTPNSTGYTQRLEFTVDTVKYYFNDELMSESPYSIEIQESTIHGGTHEMLITMYEARNIVQFNNFY